MSSATCVVLRPVACSICSRQLNPLASRRISEGATRTLGSSTRSAAVIDTAYFSDSNPNDPANPATAGWEKFVIEAEALEHALLRLRLDDRMMVAMDLNQRRSLDKRQRRIRRVAVDEFGEERRLAAEPLGERILREQARQLIAKAADAGRLQANDGRAGLDLGPQVGHRATPKSLRRIEHAPVVERTPAAMRPVGNDDGEAEALEHVDRRDRGLRAETPRPSMPSAAPPG
jgi:hypothetical protein